MSGLSDEDRDAFGLFIEKVVSLAGSSFCRTIQEGDGIKLNVRWTRDGISSARLEGPEGESVDAALLTLRMLLQDNDGISIRKVTSRVKLLPESPQRTAIIESRDAINRRLDQESEAVEGCDRLSYREIVHVYLYGQYAHTNPKHRSRLKEWNAKPFSRHFFELLFLNTVQQIIECAWVIAVNLRVILGEGPLAAPPSLRRTPQEAPWPHRRPPWA